MHYHNQHNQKMLSQSKVILSEVIIKIVPIEDPLWTMKKICLQKQNMIYENKIN